MLDAHTHFNSSDAPYDNVRRAAFAYAEAQGLPTRRLEAWHYTDLAQLLRQEQNARTPSVIDISGINPLRAVFHNGVLDVARSDLADTALQLTPYQVEAATGDLPAMEAYNLALSEDGLRLHIAGTPRRPLEIITTGVQPIHLRHRIICDAGTEVTLIENNAVADYGNLWSDIVVGAGATLHLVRLQQSGTVIATQHIHLEAGAQCRITDFILGGAVVRHETHINLCGEASAAHLHSAILGQYHNHNDISCVLHHQAANTQSHTTSHNLLTDGARGVFQGKIIVARDAQHIDARQHVAALMLSDTAEMDTKPELEIYADDVACAHGAAIGTLDEDALFFLRARGIDAQTARHLLILGFLEQVSDSIVAPRLRGLVQAHLKTQIEAMGDV